MKDTAYITTYLIDKNFDVVKTANTSCNWFIGEVYCEEDLSSYPYILFSHDYIYVFVRGIHLKLIPYQSNYSYNVTSSRLIKIENSFQLLTFLSSLKERCGTVI